MKIKAGNTTPTLWGIRAGKTGDADNLFLKYNVVALGWAEKPDPRRYHPCPR